jgi:microcystin-dependent protein
MVQPYVEKSDGFAGNLLLRLMFCQGHLNLLKKRNVFFQLIGTTYGGTDKQFLLCPDMRGRLPVHQGQWIYFGRKQVELKVTFTVNQAHSHPFLRYPARQLRLIQAMAWLPKLNDADVFW